MSKPETKGARGKEKKTKKQTSMRRHTGGSMGLAIDRSKAGERTTQDTT